MAVNYKVFVDGERLPEGDLNNFLAKQCVVQVDGQNDLVELVEYGVRMAITVDTGEAWLWTELGGWAKFESDGFLTQDTADERYLTRLTAEGLFLSLEESADFLTGDDVASTYLAKLDATGLYLSQTDAQQDYLGKTEASNTYLASLTAQGLYLSQSSANNSYLNKNDAANTYLTSVTAQGIYLSQSSANNTYITSSQVATSYQQKPSSGTFITTVTAGNLYVSKGGAAGDINGNSTTIDGGKITANSISASSIGAGVITGVRIQTSDSGQRVLMSESSNSLVFYNGSGSIVGRMQAGVAGSVLDITGAGSAGMSIGNSSTVFDGNVSTANSANIFATGRLGQNSFASLGTTTPVGRQTSTGLFGPSGSDERIKKNIVEVNNGLDIVNQLRPVKFQFISEDEGPVSYGLIAQEVQPLFDDIDNVVNVMSPDEEGMEYLSINYDAFISPLISAVKELSAKNDALEARLAALEGGTI